MKKNNYTLYKMGIYHYEGLNLFYIYLKHNSVVENKDKTKY
jgi:hypothetical protein